MSNSTKSTIAVKFRPAKVCKGKELYVEYYCRSPFEDVMKHARHWSLEVTKTYLIHDEIEANKNILNALEL